ncbi:MAG TPA: glycosyltransferase family 2 protein [Chloroflexota bacterium]|jgi:glycosyltransferase involved in cell wall biosynthesis|nr:glycosyltransferase family 2 protein [Chloroflexota bacterium]
MAARPTIAVVIPAWDEAVSIGAVLDEVPAGVIDQVLVVVASPTDPTADVARAHGATVLVQHAAGYGAACWTGAQAAIELGAQVIAFLDGDYADPPAELPRLLAPLCDGRADLVLGCRDLRQHPEALPIHARAGNRLVLLLLRLLLGAPFTDLPSFKAIRVDALRRLDMHEMTYGWTVEMLVKSWRARLRVAEIHVTYRPRRGGHSKVAGSLSGSLRAATKLVGCAVGYVGWRPDARPALGGSAWS